MKKGEIYQGYNDPVLTTCPVCDTETLVRIISVPTIINKAPRTLGTWAERNAKKLGKEKIESMEKENNNLTALKEENRKKNPRPFWRPDSDKPLDLKKVKDVKKYIETGKQ